MSQKNEIKDFYLDSINVKEIGGNIEGTAVIDTEEQVNRGDLICLYEMHFYILGVKCVGAHKLEIEIFKVG